MNVVAQLAESMALGNVLEQVRTRWGGYRLLDHWQQGEFHHDVVLTVEGVDNPEFAGKAPTVLAAARTHHWFDPCELLRSDARSEYREEQRQRQCGGGWKPKVS